MISPKGVGLISAVNTAPCSRDTGQPCPWSSAAKLSAAADFCQAPGVAIPTTLEAVHIKAAITTYSACMCRLGITIILGALRCGSVRSRAYVAVAALPQSAGLRESPVVIHGYNQLQFPSLQASAASIVTA